MIQRHSRFIIPPNDVKEDLLEIGAVKLDILDSGYNLTQMRLNRISSLLQFTIFALNYEI